MRLITTLDVPNAVSLCGCFPDCYVSTTAVTSWRSRARVLPGSSFCGTGAGAEDCGIGIGTALSAAQPETIFLDRRLQPHRTQEEYHSQRCCSSTSVSFGWGVFEQAQEGLWIALERLPEQLSSRGNHGFGYTSGWLEACIQADHCRSRHGARSAPVVAVPKVVIVSCGDGTMAEIASEGAHPQLTIPSLSPHLGFGRSSLARFIMGPESYCAADHSGWSPKTQKSHVQGIYSDVSHTTCASLGAAATVAFLYPTATFFPDRCPSPWAATLRLASQATALRDQTLGPRI